MQNNNTQGFTLIELLIVIAIIGILAAVLIPNLLGARQSAQERAAQAFSANVATAATAYAAATPSKTPTEVANIKSDCNTDEAYTYPPADDGTVVGYGAAPASVAKCTVTADDKTGVIKVTVTTQNGTSYVNGAKDKDASGKS